MIAPARRLSASPKGSPAGLQLAGIGPIRHARWFSVLLILVLWPLAACAVGPVVIGPGERPFLYVNADENYHVLDGTRIVSPSLTGPPRAFVVVTDAIEFRGGGHIRIDGGNFRGGDATYTGSINSASTVAGDALHLRQSTGEVHGGTFIGGKAFSTSRGIITNGGDGLILVESDIVIYDGYFEGGVSTQPQFFGEVRTSQSPAIIAYDGSNVIMHGGETNGDIYLTRGSSLSIFGTNLDYDGRILTGTYADGTSFRHVVPPNGGVVLFNSIIPEPSAAAMFAAAGIFPLLRRRRSRKRGHFC